MSAAEPSTSEHSAGGIVFRVDEKGISVLLIRDGHGNWGFPKGHVEPPEEPAQTARREIGEETGIADLETRQALGSVRWTFHKRGRPVLKICDLFLFESRGGDPRPQAEEGITRAEWVKLGEAVERISYQNIKDVLVAVTPDLLNAGGPSRQRVG